MIDIVNLHFTMLWLIRENTFVKGFQGGFYFDFRKFNIFFIDLLHFFDKLWKDPVAKAFQKKVVTIQAVDFAYIKLLYIGMLPRLNDFFGATIYAQCLGNIIGRS